MFIRSLIDSWKMMVHYMSLAFILVFCTTQILAQNIGIGTTDPDEKLTVSGTIKTELNSSAGNPHIIIHEQENEFGRLRYTNTSSPEYFNLAGNPQRDSTQARFHINYSEFGNVGSFTGHGRFGLNATNPAAAFHVNAQPNTDLMRMQINNNTKLRIFGNDAMVFGANWANPIPDVIRMETPHLFIGFDGNHVPQNRLEVDGTVEMKGLKIPYGHQDGYVLTSDAEGEATWKKLPIDNDDDPLNEIQTVSKSETLVTLSNGGGSFKVDDNDPNPENEIQTLSKMGNLVSLSMDGGSFTDEVNDADASPSNELQTLSISGSNLSISNGNTVTLPNTGGGGTSISSPDGNEVVDTDASGLFPEVTMKVSGINSFSFRRPNDHPSLLFSGPKSNISITSFYPPFIATDAEKNVSIGPTFQSTAISGSQNVIIGEHSSQDYAGDDNVIIGNTTGAASEHRFRNVFIGPNSGQSVSSNNNVCIGYLAGNGAFQQCVYIGENAGPNGQGDWRRAVGIGYFTAVTANNQFVFGSSLATEIGGYEPWSNLSDGRFKRNIKNDVPGLEFINALEPITYNVDAFAVEEFVRSKESFEQFKKENEVDLRRSNQKIESGFIAQEVEAAARSLGYDFDGVVPPQNEKDPYALAYSQFVVPLVKAVQELDEKNVRLEEENTSLKLMLEQLSDDFASFKAQYETDKKRLVKAQ